MFIKILILSIIASVAVAGNPDAPGYFEPRLTIGAGEGVIRSDMLESDIEMDTKLNVIGFAVESLIPFDDRASLLLNFGFNQDRIEWEGDKTKTNIFRFSIAIRFYPKGD